MKTEKYVDSSKLKNPDLEIADRLDKKWGPIFLSVVKKCDVKNSIVTPRKFDHKHCVPVKSHKET